MTHVLNSIHSLEPFDQQYYGTQDMVYKLPGDSSSVLEAFFALADETEAGEAGLRTAVKQYLWLHACQFPSGLSPCGRPAVVP